jgi:3-oxoacyl-[acyl-carrier-protein] synthase II
MSRRVVVTGLGMVTSLGADVTSTWAGVLAGKSGISNIDHFDTTQYKTRFAGLVRDLKAEDYMPAKELRRYDVFMHYALAAGVQAMNDSKTGCNFRKCVSYWCGDGLGYWWFNDD